MLRRVAWITAPAVLVAVSLIAVFAALAYGGGADPTLATGKDPGAIVRFGIPVGTMLYNLGAAGTLGGLVLACFALDPKRPEYGRALDVAAASAGVWAVASGFTAFVTFVGRFEIKTFDDNSFAIFGQYLTSTENGQAWLATTLIAAAVTVLCFAVRNQTVLLFVTAFAVVGACLGLLAALFLHWVTWHARLSYLSLTVIAGALSALGLTSFFLL